MSNIKKVAVKTTDDTADKTAVGTTKVTVEKLAGVPEGTEINGEVVVADKDGDGNVTGWHKEPQKGVK